MSNEEEQGVDTALFQGDLAVNLFMVLLSILATLTIVASVVSNEGFRETLRSERESPEDILSLSPGWAPVQPLRQRLLVRSDGLWKLDQDAFALAAANGLPPVETRPGYASVTPLDDDPDPQAYRVNVFLGTDPLAPKLTEWHLPMGSLPLNLDEDWPDDWVALLEQANALDLAIYAKGQSLAWHVAARLHQQTIPFRLIYQSRDMIRYGRESRFYTFEETYR